MADPRRQTSHVGTRSGVKHTQTGDRDPSHNRRSIDDSERAHENKVSWRRVTRAKRYDTMPTNQITHMIRCGGKANRQERENAGARPFVQKHTATEIPSGQGTGKATRTPTPKDEVARARILDLTVDDGAEDFRQGAPECRDASLPPNPPPPFPRFTSSLSFAFEVVGWFVVVGEAGC